MKPKLRLKKPVKPLPLSAVVALFKKHCKRGPWPDESQCYYLRNDINVVANAKPAAVLNDDPKYRRRRATIAAMEKLIREMKAQDPFPGLRFATQIEAEIHLGALEEALGRAKPALTGWTDPWAGEREGAAWHKPARFIARRVKEAAINAGRKKVSFAKGSPLVLVVTSALILARQKKRDPDAVAAALAKFPL
ncbi:MAG: hypothetical protein WCP68_00825 [Enhydrobacter sp.]